MYKNYSDYTLRQLKLGYINIIANDKVNEGTRKYASDCLDKVDKELCLRGVNANNVR